MLEKTAFKSVKTIQWVQIVSPDDCYVCESCDEDCLGPGIDIDENPWDGWMLCQKHLILELLNRPLEITHEPT